MSSRPPLTPEERAQIKALMRFLIVVLLAVAVASVAVGIAITVLQPGVPSLDATPAP